MALGVLIIVTLSLLLYFVPAFLSRKPKYRDASEFLIASRETPQSIFKNASVAYALQMATFGPFFVWGLFGDFWPGLINSLCFGLGLYIIYLLRQPILSFIRENLALGKSFTLHNFIATSHGGASSVRLAASILTIIGLWGIVMAEMFGAAVVLQPLLGGDGDSAFQIVILLFFAMLVYSTYSGNSGVLRVDQLQLAIAYLCILVIIALSLFNSLVAPAAPSDTFLFSVVLLSIAILFILIRRRGKIIEFNLPTESEVAAGKTNGLRKGYRLIEKTLNFAVLIAFASVLVLAVIKVSDSGVSASLSAVSNKLSMESQFGWLVFLVLIVLPLLFQVCDITNWQRIAALQPGKNFSEEEFKKSFLDYTIEAPAVWIILLSLGGLSVAIDPSIVSSSDPVPEFVQNLMSNSNVGNAVILMALATAICAIALSTMDAVLAASLAAYRYDILPSLQKRKVLDEKENAQEDIRGSITFGVISYTVVILLLYVLEAKLSFGMSTYLGALMGFYTAQLSFFPLLAGAIYSKASGKAYFLVSPSAALTTLAVGAGFGIGLTFLGLGTGTENYIWSAVPLCLISSCVIYGFNVIAAYRVRNT